MEFIMLFRCFVIFIAALFILSCTGCKRSNSKREKYVQKMIQDQSKYQQLAKGLEVEGEKAGEAKSWLVFTNTQNVLPSTGRKQTQEFVEDLYDSGATRVWCIYVTKQATFQANMCTSLLIELPKDEAKRKEVLKIYHKIEKEFWKDSTTKIKDEGQTYLHLTMDP